MEEAGLRPAGDDGTWFQKFRVGGRSARNVIGMLEGADPELRKEVVVLGAHYDHVGTAEQGNPGRLGGARGGDGIYNGADDNASGVAALLAVAEAMGKGGVRTRRSALFAAFSGEEEGLLGSRHYVNHPPAPLAQHVFMLNLDMVGRNPERPMEIHGAGSAEGGVLRKAVEDSVAKTGLKAKVHDAVKLILGDSDHASFSARRIPFLFFFGGFHSDYHRVTDHADKIAYDNLARVAQTAFHIVVEVGDAAERPRFSAAAAANPFRLPDFDFGEPPRPPRRLGVTVQELDDAGCDALGLGPDQGALRVEDVHAGGAAAAAGVQAGDAVLGIAGVRFPRTGGRDRLRRLLSEKVRPGQDVDLTVLRKGETLTLKAKWSE
jgi:acetylornithine deacetylase/succinyl-diaminopimelate desuccinylase-like protein